MWPVWPFVWPQVQYGAYAGVGGVANIVKMLFAGMMFWFLVKFSFGRDLLIKVNKDTHTLIYTYTHRMKTSLTTSFFSPSSLSLVSRVFLLWFLLQGWTDKKAGTVLWISLVCKIASDWCLSVTRMDGWSFSSVIGVFLCHSDGGFVLQVCLLRRRLHWGTGPQPGTTQC